MRSRILVLTGVLLALSTGCTIRYSQSVAGNVPNASGQRVQSSDSGLSIFSITFNEPKSAHEQVVSLLGACSSLTKVQVDYRETGLFIVGFPKVSVTATCVR